MPPLVVGTEPGTPVQQSWPTPRRTVTPRGEHVIWVGGGPGGWPEGAGRGWDEVVGEFAGTTFDLALEMDGRVDERSSMHADWLDFVTSNPLACWKQALEHALHDHESEAELRAFHFTEGNPHPARIVRSGSLKAIRDYAETIRGMDARSEIASRLRDALVATPRLDSLAAFRWFLRFWDSDWQRDLITDRVGTRRDELRGIFMARDLGVSGWANTEFGAMFVLDEDLIEGPARDALLDDIEKLLGLPIRLVCPSDYDETAEGARAHSERL